MVNVIKSDEIILHENIIKALEKLYEDIGPLTDKEEWKKLILGLLDKQAKYEWHDLRKNPDDLPIKNGRYLVLEEINQFGTLGYNIRGFYKNRKLFDVMGVVAWREIERLEGE